MSSKNSDLLIITSVGSLLLFLGSFFLHQYAENQSKQASTIRSLPSYHVISAVSLLHELIELNPKSSSVSLQCHVTGLTAPSSISVSHPEKSIAWTQDDRIPAIMTKTLEYELFDTLRQQNKAQINAQTGELVEPATYSLDRSQKLHVSIEHGCTEGIHIIDLQDTSELDKLIERTRSNLRQPAQHLHQEHSQHSHYFSQQSTPNSGTLHCSPSKSSPPTYQDAISSVESSNSTTTPSAPTLSSLQLSTTQSPILKQLHIFLPRSQIGQDLFKLHHSQTSYLNNHEVIVNNHSHSVSNNVTNTTTIGTQTNITNNNMTGSVVNNNIVNNAPITTNSTTLNTNAQPNNISTSNSNSSYSNIPTVHHETDSRLNKPRLVGHIKQEFYLPFTQLQVYGEIYLDSHDPSQARVREIRHEDNVYDPIISTDDKDTVVNNLLSGSRLSYWGSYFFSALGAAALLFIPYQAISGPK